MTDPSERARTHEDLASTLESLSQIARQSLEAFQRQSGTTPSESDADSTSEFDPAQAFAKYALETFADWSGPAGGQIEHWARFIDVWRNVTERTTDPSIEPIASPDPLDRRFRDPSWDANPAFDLLKQHYLVTSRWIDEELRELTGIDERSAQLVRFYTRQFVDALAPSNFLLTNPEALRATLDTSGDNLIAGLGNLLVDLERGRGRLRVRTNDPEAFEVGRNLATTPGKVVFTNDLIELIQFAPMTEQVHERPLLIVPPWINKYYILDLQPENSFVRWVVEQGYTVFVISWVNPDERHASKTFESYMLEGPLAAMDAIEALTGQHEVSALGYCLGGTLTAATLAHLAAREDNRVTSCTLLAAQVDFSEPGELGVFATESQIEAIERRMEANGGYLEADTMTTTFNMLRANDLIWSYVVSNYLLGRDPPPFDLLYWNSDATSMPAPMQSYYLRNMYLRNALVEPNTLELGGTLIDLRRVSLPVYLHAAREDHIAPYASVFKGTRHLGGDVRFVLAGSGHIAGVVNPPLRRKYGYLTGEHARDFASAEKWIEQAEEHEGSWWTDWEAWLAQHSGPLVPSRSLPEDSSMLDSPGSYVHVRA